MNNKQDNSFNHNLSNNNEMPLSPQPPPKKNNFINKLSQLLSTNVPI